MLIASWGEVMAYPARQEHVRTFSLPKGRESLGEGSTLGGQIPRCGARSARRIYSKMKYDTWFPRPFLDTWSKGALLRGFRQARTTPTSKNSTHGHVHLRLNQFPSTLTPPNHPIALSPKRPPPRT